MKQLALLLIIIVCDPIILVGSHKSVTISEPAGIKRLLKFTDPKTDTSYFTSTVARDTLNLLYSSNAQLKTVLQGRLKRYPKAQYLSPREFRAKLLSMQNQTKN